MIRFPGYAAPFNISFLKSFYTLPGDKKQEAVMEKFFSIVFKKDNFK